MFKLRKGLVATAAIVAMLGTGMVVSADSTVGPNEQSVLEHIKEYANAEARGFYGLAESQFCRFIPACAATGGRLPSNGAATGFSTRRGTSTR